MTTRDIDKILAEQAAELLEAVQRGEPGANERLSAFLSESRRHVKHVLRASALELEFPHLDQERRFATGPIEGAGSNVVPLQEAPAVDPAPIPSVTPLIPEPPQTIVAKRLNWWALAAVFAGILVAAGSSFLLWNRAYGWHEVTTAFGEQRTLDLRDGSVVQVNTASKLRYRLSEHRRDIRLLRGEALFHVYHDPARPFRVRTDDATVVAVGTEFTVYQRPEGTEVAVREGRVQVLSGEVGDAVVEPNIATPDAVALTKEKTAHRQRAASLGAGEQAIVGRSGDIATQSVDVASVGGWRERRLFFKSAPLSEIVEQYGRYKRVPHFVLADSGIADQRFSGIFDLDQPDTLVTFLKGEPGLRIEVRGEDVLIHEDDRATGRVIAESAAASPP